MNSKLLFSLVLFFFAFGLLSCGKNTPQKVDLPNPPSETTGFREVSSEIELRWDIQDIQILTSQLSSKMSKEKFSEIQNFPIPLEIGPFENKTSDQTLSPQDLQGSLMANLIRDNRFQIISTQEMLVPEEMFVESEDMDSGGTTYRLLGEIHHNKGEDSGNPTSIFSLKVELRSPGKPGQQTVIWTSQVDSGKIYKP